MAVCARDGRRTRDGKDRRTEDGARGGGGVGSAAHSILTGPQDGRTACRRRAELIFSCLGMDASAMLVVPRGARLQEENFIHHYSPLRRKN